MKYIITILFSLVLFTACSSDTTTDQAETNTNTSPETVETSQSEDTSVVAEPEDTSETAVPEDTSESTESATSDQLELNLEELSAFNGKDGQPAYVAVDGVIYDVTESAAWNNGQHNGFEAGKDLTEEIKNQSPHGVSKLEGFNPIGILVD